MAIGTTAALIGGSVASAAIGASSAKSAARSQERAANDQIALQREVYDDQTKRFEPFYGAGQNALGAVNFEMGLGARPQGYEGFTATPGYEFRRDEGTRAVNALAGARGGLNSGRTMQDLTRFGQGIASEEYGNYINRLFDMTNMGANAAGMQAQAGSGFAAGTSNALANRGNAQAAGAIGVGNALQGGLQTGIGLYQYQQGLARQPFNPATGQGNWWMGRA